MLGQDVVDHLNHLVHHLRRFTYRQSAYGITVAVEVAEAFGSILPEVGIDAALYDGEEMLPVAVGTLRGVKAADTTV